MKVLIAYDGSAYADLAIEDLAWAGLPKNCQALVLSVVEAHAAHEWMAETKTALQAAESACNRVQSLFPGWDVWLETPSGHAAAMILERAATWPAGLIVVGTHGRRGLARLVLGSVSGKIVHEASCSVRTSRGGIGRKDSPIHLLIGNDGSPEGEAAVDEVCGRSWPAGAEARVLSVVQTLAPVDAESYALATHSLLASDTFLKSDAEERRRCERVVEASALKLRNAGLQVSIAVEDGDPKRALLHQAQTWNADTIFVGARGLGLVDRFVLGSVSGAMVSHAPCTVEVVRHHIQGDRL